MNNSLNIYKEIYIMKSFQNMEKVLSTQAYIGVVALPVSC